MRTSFLSPASIENRLHVPDHVTVSRMRHYTMRPSPPKGSLPGKKGRDVMFANVPIEKTVRMRQSLRASCSAPSLAAPGSPRSATVLPRICAIRRGADRDVADDASPADGPAWLSQQLGGDAWMDLHWSGRRLELPFGQCHDDARDTESFVHWYQLQESEALYSGLNRSDTNFQVTILPWSQEHRLTLLALKRAERGTGRYIRLQDRAELFGHLVERNPAKGTEALAEALIWKLGAFDDAYRFLDISSTGELGLMEFVGCMSVLGLDTHFLCGMDERSTFRRVDWHNSGAVKVQDLLRRYRGRKVMSVMSMETNVEKGENADKVQNVDKSLACAPSEDFEEPIEKRLAVVKWVAVAKWMAAAQQRSAAIRGQRLRHGWKSVSLGDKAAVAGDEESEIVASTLASPSMQTSGTGPRARTAAEVTKESAVTMREQEFAIRGSFSRNSSVTLPDGSRLLSKSDLYKFFSDLDLVDSVRHKFMSGPLIDKLYDEAIDLQCGLTKIGTGLTFWSFKVVLNNAIAPLGFKWSSLVERTMHLERISDAMSPASS